MVDTLKILAQLSPSPGTLTDFYTVPALTSTTLSSIMVCNQSSSATIAFRISVAAGGSADDPKQYIYFDVPLISNDTFVAVIGLTLSATDVIRVRSDQSSVSFSAFGVEIN